MGIHGLIGRGLWRPHPELHFFRRDMTNRSAPTNAPAIPARRIKRTATSTIDGA